MQILPLFHGLFTFQSDAFPWGIYICGINPKGSCVWWEVHVPWTVDISLYNHFCFASLSLRMCTSYILVFMWRAQLTNSFPWVALFLPKAPSWWQISLPPRKAGKERFSNDFFLRIDQPFRDSGMAGFRLDSSHMQKICGWTPPQCHPWERGPNSSY